MSRQSHMVNSISYEILSYVFFFFHQNTLGPNSSKYPPNDSFVLVLRYWHGAPLYDVCLDVVSHNGATCRQHVQTIVLCYGYVC
jgi:hypothetical protein